MDSGVAVGLGSKQSLPAEETIMDNPSRVNERRKPLGFMVRLAATAADG